MNERLSLATIIYINTCQSNQCLFSSKIYNEDKPYVNVAKICQCSIDYNREFLRRI